MGLSLRAPVQSDVWAKRLLPVGASGVPPPDL